MVRKEGAEKTPRTGREVENNFYHLLLRSAQVTFCGCLMTVFEGYAWKDRVEIRLYLVCLHLLS